jgi:hypothetical protein
VNGHLNAYLPLGRPRCAAADLIGRGLKLDGRVPCIIDGQGYRKAIDEVLGDLAVLQRCQRHYADRRIMPTSSWKRWPGLLAGMARSA